MGGSHTVKLAHLALCATLLLWGSSAHAETQGDGDAYSPIIELGLYFGVEDLSTARFVNGTNDSVEAGGLLDFNLGAVRHLDDRHELQVTLGFRFDGTNGTTGNVSWSRWVVEGKYFYRMAHARLGLGVSYHINPSFEINLEGFPSTAVDFDNGLGYVLEWDHLSRHTYYGLKYTLIDYTGGGLSVDGSSIALVYGFNFR